MTSIKHRNLKYCKKNTYFFVLTILLFIGITTSNVYGATEAAMLNGTVTGTIKDKSSKQPMEYANVSVYNKKDSSLVSGSISGNDGTFTIKDLVAGDYYIEAKFIGYEAFMSNEFVIKKNNSRFDIGTILLNNTALNLTEVSITGQKNAIEYHLDKKILDPSQFPSAAGGTAIDILANAPSISVDIEGNVSLRGSSNFTVYVDGRPTPFDPAEALEQIPASSIRNIEVITNPSAKFDPDGTSGIININTKKSKMNGFSGIINTTADSQKSLSGDFLLNYKLGKFNFFVGGSRANRYGQGDVVSNSMSVDNDTIYNTMSDGEGHRNRISQSLKTGLDFSINDKNVIAFNVDLNKREGDRGSDVNFHEEHSTVNPNTVFFTEDNISKNTSVRSGNSQEYTVDYRKTFEREGQELTAMFNYEVSDGEEATNNLQLIENSPSEGLKSWEIEDEKNYRAKIDFVYPTRYKGKLEAGYQARIDRSNEFNNKYNFTKTKGTYNDYSNYKASTQSEHYRLTNFDRDIHAVYATFSQEIGPIGYQVGLRGEYTKREISYSGDSKTYTIDRTDPFPTLHLSYNLSEEHQFAASYSRRIQRPRGGNLEPFITYRDAYNIKKGNPSLKPEYIDSYELGYNFQMEKGFFSAESYYRKVNNKIEDVESVYAPNVMIRQPENIGTSYYLGIESILNYTAFKVWTSNLMLNIFNYKISGEANGENYDSESYNWNTRWNNSFILTKTTKLQADVMYNSPTVTAQGRREGFAFTNIGLRQDMFDKRLSATFTIRDLFDTAKFENRSSGTNFSKYRKFDLNSPVFSLTLSYKLNNFQQKKKKGSAGGEGESEGAGAGEF